MTKKKTASKKAKRTAPAKRVSKPTRALTKTVLVPKVLEPEVLEPAVEDLLEALSPAEKTFALAYLANGFNATAAYREAHPGTLDTSAQVGGWRMLRNVKVAAYLRTKTEKAWKPLQLGGEEALARVGMIAVFDARLLVKDGQLLPVDQWPEEAGALIESIDLAMGKIKLPSRLAALRTILELTGKLKSLAGGLDELAEAIRADRLEHGEARL